VIIAITMVRDELDILPHTLAHTLEQVDHVIVADNRSTDGTSDFLTDAASRGRVTVIEDPEVGYYQARKMTELAHRAGDMGATWVVPFDADEAIDLPDLAAIPPRVADVIYVRSWWYVPQPDDNAEDPNPLTRVRYHLPDAQPLPKVLFRYHSTAALHQGNHGVDRPGRAIWGGRLRHYPFRSLEQVRRKITNGIEAYSAAPDLAGHGDYWRTLARLEADGALEE
jgi:glycosyltransferase involved in cell wall biosynthesis